MPRCPGELSIAVGWSTEVDVYTSPRDPERPYRITVLHGFTALFVKRWSFFFLPYSSFVGLGSLCAACYP